MKNKKLKIGIIGTRGIPNHYGGFEQFAESLSVFLAEKNHEVYVYNSSNHPYQKDEYKGVKIIKQADPENKIGTAGQFIYDLNCILDSRKRKFDIILQLGYTSSSVWSFLFPKKPLIITNMDGLEWKRNKYSKPVKLFLKYAEKLAVKKSDYLIADSKGIQSYLKTKYNVQSKFIAYGSHIFSTPNKSILSNYNLEANNYNMLIARIEPENNIETILDGVALANTNKKFIVVGDYQRNPFAKKMVEKFSSNKNIIFLGSIYDINILNNLRYYSNLYFHGHSVGGTNPSLLEAMGCKCLIIAHNNEFNKSVIENNGFYFKTPLDIKNIINKVDKIENIEKTEKNLQKIKEYYNLENINNTYLSYFNDCLETHK